MLLVRTKCQRLTFLTSGNIASGEFFLGRLTSTGKQFLCLDSSKLIPFQSPSRTNSYIESKIRVVESSNFINNGSTRFLRSWAICEYRIMGATFSICILTFTRSAIHVVSVCSGCKTTLKHRHTARITHGRAINRRSHIKQRTIKVTLRDNEFLYDVPMKN